MWAAKAMQGQIEMLAQDCPSWTALEYFVSWAQNQGLTVMVTSPKGKTFGMSLRSNPCR